MYKIGDKEFIQAKCSLKVLRSLLVLISDIDLSNKTAMGLIVSLSDKMPKLLSLVLKCNSEVKNLEEYLNENIDLETTIKIIEDFLVLNPISGVVQKLLPSLGKV